MPEKRRAEHENEEPRGIPRDEEAGKPGEQEGQFGEEFGNDYGYGSRGSQVEPDVDEQEEGEEYVDRMDMSRYTDILLDEEQGRQREQTLDQRDDDRIYSEVAQSLVRHNLLDTGEITLVVDGGEVTLRGTVRRAEEAHTAGEAAREVLGVKRVENQIQVRGDRAG